MGRCVSLCVILSVGSGIAYADPPAGQPLSASEAARAFGAREDIEDISLSPDGTKVAFITPIKGQGGALVTMPIGADGARTVALAADGDPERLSTCHWVSNTRLVCILYGVVQRTEEILPFSRLVAVNADGTNIKMLSTRQNEFSRGIQLYGGTVVDWLPGETDAVLMTRNYVPDDHTGTLTGSAKSGLAVDRIDTVTLRSSPVEIARPAAAQYISDGQGRVRIMGLRKADDTGRNTGVIAYRYRTRDAQDWKPLTDLDTVKRDGFNPIAVDSDKDVAYGLRKKDGRQALYKLSLDGSGKEELAFARPDVDVDQLVQVGRRNRVVGVSYATDIRHSVYFEPELEKIASKLSQALPGQPQTRIVDASQDESKLLIWAGGDTSPGIYYVLDRKTHQLAILADVRPQLRETKLATVSPMHYPATDGTTVPGYLTLPPDGRSKNLPAIVLPHGGPGDRDEWGFDWLVQFYANRGYAVLQPNFRGSTGYGDAWFQDNGFKSWRVAIGDVLDAGRWLVKQGIADPSKLAILGWSYGGYAALQSAVVDPGLFRAVVAIAPVTDLASLKEESRNFTNYRVEGDYIGSGPHIREGSPAQNADRIKVPVLMFQGVLDRNVRVSESRLMDGKLKAAGVPHELVTWPNLDHYLDDSAARAEMLEKSDAFLRKTMGM